MQTPSGLTAEAWKLDNPVKCERRLPRAPSDMLALIAIRHGLDPDAAETSKHRLRLVADIAVVGASTSWVCPVEGQTFEVSDCFRTFPERWHEDQFSAPRVIDGRAEKLEAGGTAWTSPEALADPGVPSRSPGERP